MRHKFSMVASLTNRSNIHCVIIDESFNPDKLIAFFSGAYVSASKPEMTSNNSSSIPLWRRR